MARKSDEKTPLLTERSATIQQEYSETFYSSNQAENDTTYQFSFRKLLSFVGPGFLISIAYLDPGNIEADLQAGASTQYKLLWVLLWSTVLGLLTQRMASRIGVVTGYQMSELCYKIYPKVPRILLWIMMEIAIIGSDIQEVIGTAIAFHILSIKTIPIWGGVIITLADTFVFLLLENYGLRRLEVFFAFLIAVMAVTFGYEYGVAKPDQLSVVDGILIPYCKGCDGYTAWMQGVGILGACIMPHNLYLHSSLVKSREIDRTKSGHVKEANFYNLLETSFSLFISFIINLFVISVFASGLYNTPNNHVHDMCLSRNNSEGEQVFPNNTDIVSGMNIYKGGIYLSCAFGSVALYVWAVGIWASGQSSTMTGTYSGQVIMEGFLNLRWTRWKRVLFTRSIAVMPSLFIAKFGRIQDLTELNDYMNILMSIQLPFAIYPALTITNSRYIMGEFRNGWKNKIILGLLAFIIVVVNIYVFIDNMLEMLPFKIWVWVLMAIPLILYICFTIFLVIFQFAVEGYDNKITRLLVSTDQDLYQHIHSPDVLQPPPVEEPPLEPPPIA